MKDRTWNIRLNLDEFNAICGMAFTEADRSALLGGLQLGCNEGTLPEHCSNIVRTAYEIGMGWRQEAEGYKKRKSDAGHKSAEARKIKYGTSMPNSVRTPLEQCPNQSTIHNLQTTNEQSNNPKKKKEPRVKEWMVALPQPIVDATQQILSFWPKGGTPQPKAKNGERVPVSSSSKLAARLKGIANEGGDLGVCVEIARRYTDEVEQKIHWCKAAENFFGPGRTESECEWKPLYQAHITNKAMHEAHDASDQ